MNHLLHAWPDIARRIQKAPAVALFLDFDGTLAPFVWQPSAARLPCPTRRVLQRLARLPGLRTWIVSARREDDVRSRIAVSRLHCLGLYGWENGAVPQSKQVENCMLLNARSAIAESIHSIPGVWIEDKKATFALHWRGAPPSSFHCAARVFADVMGQFDGGLRVMRGDRVWEVAPASLPGKDVAVRHHWRAWRGSALPIYLGDSPADEPAFAALACGITVCIGRARSTRAQFRLRGPSEVRAFLEKLDREIRSDLPQASERRLAYSRIDQAWTGSRPEPRDFDTWR